MATAKRDANRVPTLIGVSSVDGKTPELVYINPTTHEVLGKVSVNPLTTVYQGTKTVPTVTAEAIAATQAIVSVTIKALSTNTAAVYIGASGVTTASGFELLAGESVTLDISNLATVFCISAAVAQVVRYIAI